MAKEVVKEDGTTHVENDGAVKKPTLGQKLKRHCARFWWLHLLIFIAVVLVIVLPMSVGIHHPPCISHIIDTDHLVTASMWDTPIYHKRRSTNPFSASSHSPCRTQHQTHLPWSSTASSTRPRNITLTWRPSMAHCISRAVIPHSHTSTSPRSKQTTAPKAMSINEFRSPT